MTIDRDRILEVLRSRREHIEHTYGLRMVGVVGSVARGEANEESDVDVFVDVVGASSLFRLFDAENELKDAVGIGMPVEFVFREALRPTMRARMERDLLPL